MRPAGPICVSWAACRSASPGMDASVGFSRTATFTSTWGNLVRHAARAEKGCPVARRRVVEEEEVPRLLAAQARPQAQHLLEHIAVTHLSLHAADALLAEGAV